MNYLFFDTETTGLPRDYRAPLDNFANWPRIVELCYATIDTRWVCVAKPDGWEIPAEVSRIHGTEEALKIGQPVKDILAAFAEAVAKADVLVAHNMSFDKRIVGSEFLRAGMPNPIPAKPLVCTMKSTISYCRIPGKRGLKWPTLQELHGKLFGSGFEKAHSAGGDVTAMIRCFQELQRLGVPMEARQSIVE